MCQYKVREKATFTSIARHQNFTRYLVSRSNYYDAFMLQISDFTVIVQPQLLIYNYTALPFRYLWKLLDKPSRETKQAKVKPCVRIQVSSFDNIPIKYFSICFCFSGKQYPALDFAPTERLTTTALSTSIDLKH